MNLAGLRAGAWCEDEPKETKAQAPPIPDTLYNCHHTAHMVNQGGKYCKLGSRSVDHAGMASSRCGHANLLLHNKWNRAEGMQGWVARTPAHKRSTSVRDTVDTRWWLVKCDDKHAHGSGWY